MGLVRMAICAFLFEDSSHVLGYDASLQNLSARCNFANVAPWMNKRKRHAGCGEKQTSEADCSPPHQRLNSRCSPVIPDKVASTIASSRRCATKFTSVTPSTLCRRSAETFMGPDEAGACPG